MQKVVIFSLILLSGVTFFLGLNLGKQIEQIDSPIKATVYVTETEIIKIVTPTLEITKKPTVIPTQTPSDIPEADL